MNDDYDADRCLRRTERLNRRRRQPWLEKTMYGVRCVGWTVYLWAHLTFGICFLGFLLASIMFVQSPSRHWRLEQRDWLHFAVRAGAC